MIARIHACQIMLSASAMMATALAASPARIDVCTSCRHQTIAVGLETAAAGDTIWVQGGTYRESNLIITKPVVLTGLDNPVIDLSGGGHGIIIRANQVTVAGFVLRDVKTSHIEELSAIKVEKSHGYLIEGNTLINTYFGIYLQNTGRGRVWRNTIIGEAESEINSGNGIHMWYCDSVDIRGNEIRRHRDGIYLEFVKNSNISDNRSIDNLRYGLHFMFSNNDRYERNFFSKNGAGVAVMFSKFIDMHHNTFVENWGPVSYGLLLKEITDAEITHNRFQRNCTGILIDGCSRINYRHNDFISNGWAIKVSGGCLDNKISTNNFLDNSFDMSIQKDFNANSIGGNYWSSYEGFDLDHDGVGDVPYRPVKLFNFIVNQVPEAIVMLRSLFVDLINLAERVNPRYTPIGIVDEAPSMKKFDHAY